MHVTIPNMHVNKSDGVEGNTGVTFDPLMSFSDAAMRACDDVYVVLYLGKLNLQQCMTQARTQAPISLSMHEARAIGMTSKA